MLRTVTFQNGGRNVLPKHHLTLGTLEFTILVLIAAHPTEPAYGATVWRWLLDVDDSEESYGSPSTIYTLLSRLEKKQYISSHRPKQTDSKNPNRGSKPRRFYKIEPQGRAAVAQTQHLYNRVAASIT